MQHKRPDIEFYAVSCVAEKETCAKYKISGYPSIFTFHANSKEGAILRRSNNPLSGGYNPADVIATLSVRAHATDSKVLRKGEDEEDEEEDEKDDAENVDNVEGHEDASQGDDGEDEEGEGEGKEESEGNPEMNAESLKKASSLSGIGGTSASKLKDLKDKYAKQRVSSGNPPKVDIKANYANVSVPAVTMSKSMAAGAKPPSEQKEVDGDGDEAEEDEENPTVSMPTTKKVDEEEEEEEEDEDEDEASSEKFSDTKAVVKVPVVTTNKSMAAGAEPPSGKKEGDVDADGDDAIEDEENPTVAMLTTKEVDEEDEDEDAGASEYSNGESQSVEKKPHGDKEEADEEQDAADDDKEKEEPKGGPPNGRPREDSSIDSSVASFRAGLITKAGNIPGAGATLAGSKLHDMDRWQEVLAKRKSELLAKGGKRKPFSRPDRTTGKPLSSLDQPATQGSTTTMRANTPGNKEFDERRKRTLERIQKFREKHERGFMRKRTPMNVGTEKHLLMKKNLPFKIVPKKPTFAQKQAEKIPVIKRMFTMSSEEELILDASLSFVIGLKHGVFMSNDALTEKKKKALKDWLDLLSVGLPSEWGLHTLIDDLIQNIDFISLKDANLKKIIDKHPLPRQKWSKSCDSNGVGGFSCGMWKLFHTVTIGMAEHRGGVNLIDAEVVDISTRVFSPADAAATIREYIANFFGCKECRDHFLSQYDQCSFRRCDRLTDDANASTAEDWKQVSLWLWEVHNDVSVRVANEKATRSAKRAQMSPFRTVSQAPPVVKKEDEIKSLWPTIGECLGCFEDSGKWNEASVFAFLERTYWAGPDSKADRLLSARNIDRDTSGGSLIWFMVLVSVAIVVSLRQHLKHINKSLGLRKTIAAASAISNKLTDQVAGKRTEKKN